MYARFTCTVNVLGILNQVSAVMLAHSVEGSFCRHFFPSLNNTDVVTLYEFLVVQNYQIVLMHVHIVLHGRTCSARQNTEGQNQNNLLFLGPLYSGDKGLMCLEVENVALLWVLALMSLKFTNLILFLNSSILDIVSSYNKGHMVWQEVFDNKAQVRWEN